MVETIIREEHLIMMLQGHRKQINLSIELLENENEVQVKGT